MPFYLWMLLGFALRTVILLLLTVGVYRSSRILTYMAAIKDFNADRPLTKDLCGRAIRSHANCLENLPVFRVLALALYIRALLNMG